MELDLDKARAARAHDGHVIVFGGTTFELPPEMSVECGELFAAGDIRGGMTDLLGAQADKFYELRPTVNDLDVLVNGTDLPDGDHIPGLTDLYVPGVTLGESSASSLTSVPGSTRLRPPSRPSTG